MQNKINEPDSVKTDSTNPSQDVVESVKPSFSTVLFNKRNLWLFPVSFIIFVSLWEWIVVYFDIDDFIFPAPSDVAEALLRGLVFIETGPQSGTADFSSVMQHSFYLHISHTLFEAVLGFIIGSIIGLGLGLVFMQSKWIEAIIMPYVVAFQTLPKLAIAPLFIIWFGYEVESKVFLAGLVAFFPLLVNTMVGLRSADQDQLDLLRSLSASRWTTFRKLQFPNALPFIFAGLEIAVVFSLLGAILGEFVGAGMCMWGGRGQCGLGVLLMQMSFSADTTGTFAVLILLSFMGLGMHKIVQVTKKKILFWAPETEQTMGS
ncbi:MAG: ABC transporter permease [Nitrospinota bacterium]|nr:ABC transporter permease [Nitrospinota bacterium]